MPKIMNSTILNGNITKMMESQKGYFLNGQYYLKNSFNPIPFVSENYTAYEKCIGLNKVIKQYIGNSTGNKTFINPDIETILVDNNDESISYHTIQTNFIQYQLHVIREENDTAKKLMTINNDCKSYYSGADANSYNIFAGWLGQTEDSVYWLETGFQAYSSYYYSYSIAKKMDKSTYKVSEIYSFPGTGTNSTVYYTGGIVIGDGIVYYGSNLTSYLFKFNIESASFKQISSWDRDAQNFIVPAIKQELDGSGYAYELRNDGFIWKTSWNASGEKDFEDKLVVNVNEGDSLVPQNLNIAWQTDLYFMTVQNRDYLVINQFTNKWAIGTGKIQVLSIEDETLSLLGTTDVPRINWGCLRANNGETILFCNNNEYISVYQFSVLDGEFRQINTIDTAMYGFGLDKNENIFVYEKTGELSMYSLKTAASLDLKFADPNYKFVGEKIDTKIIVSAKNFNGEKIVANIELVIKGPMVFKEGGGKQKQVTTTIEGDLEIPVTIEGAGNVSVYPRVVIQ